MNQQSKSELLNYLIDRKKFKELYELLLGVSDDNLATFSNGEPSLNVVKLVSAVLNHLAFLDKFGDQQSHVCVDEIHYFSYPEKYAEWVDSGAPGVSLEELQRVARKV